MTRVTETSVQDVYTQKHEVRCKACRVGFWGKTKQAADEWLRLHDYYRHNPARR